MHQYSASYFFEQEDEGSLSQNQGSQSYNSEELLDHCYQSQKNMSSQQSQDMGYSQNSSILQQDQPSSQERLFYNHYTTTNNKGTHWSPQEHSLYEEFIYNNYSLAFEEEHNVRKRKKFFVLMAEKIQTRNDKQCKSHHQKCVQKGIKEQTYNKIQRDMVKQQQFILQNHLKQQQEELEIQPQQNQQQFQQQNMQEQMPLVFSFYPFHQVLINQNGIDYENIPQILVQRNILAQQTHVNNQKFQKPQIFIQSKQMKQLNNQQLNQISNLLQTVQENINHIMKQCDFIQCIEESQTCSENNYLEQETQYFNDYVLIGGSYSSPSFECMQSFQDAQQTTEQYDENTIRPFQQSNNGKVLSAETTQSTAQERKKSDPIRKRIGKKRN
ncbi:hypothetical protein ABPG74_008378 [Tetrahymena malaccensis]